MYHTELHMYMGKASGIMFIILVGVAASCYDSCVTTFRFKLRAKRIVTCANVSVVLTLHLCCS